MRILLCCEYYAPSVGGIQEVMRQVAERLVARGHEVTVATSWLPGRSYHSLNGVTIRDFAISGNAVTGIRGDVAAFQQWVLSGVFDLVMINMAQQWTLDGLIPVLKDIRSRKVLIPCGFSCLYEPSYAEYYRAMPEVLSRFDQLIFHAADYRDTRFAEQYGLDRVSIIPNGASEKDFAVSMDPAFRKKLGITEGELVFLTVGAFTPDKGHTDLVQAYLSADFHGQSSVLLLNANAYIAESQRPAPETSISAQAVPANPCATVLRHTQDSVRRMRESLSRSSRRMAGWLSGKHAAEPARPFGEEMTDLLKRVQQGNAGKRVVVMDLPRPDLIQAYKHADLFVFASRIEYSPLVLFESAAAGTPFLSARVGNAEEVVQWTGAGVIGPSRIDSKGYTRIDVARFAECWSQLVQDRARLRELGRAGNRNWAARFTWDTIAQEYEGVFQRVCAAT